MTIPSPIAIACLSLIAVLSGCASATTPAHASFRARHLCLCVEAEAADARPARAWSQLIAALASDPESQALARRLFGGRSVQVLPAGSVEELAAPPPDDVDFVYRIHERVSPRMVAPEGLDDALVRLGVRFYDLSWSARDVVVVDRVEVRAYDPTEPAEQAGMIPPVLEGFRLLVEEHLQRQLPGRRFGFVPLVDAEAVAHSIRIPVERVASTLAADPERRATLSGRIEAHAERWYWWEH